MSDLHQPTFRALSDPTRRDILRLLAAQEMTIADVSGHFDMTRAAVKKHLTVLSDGGLITVEVQGRTHMTMGLVCCTFVSVSALTGTSDRHLSFIFYMCKGVSLKGEI